MKLKNRIMWALCVAAATFSFLHPFSGKIVYAEPAITEEDTQEDVSEEDVCAEEACEEKACEEVCAEETQEEEVHEEVSKKVSEEKDAEDVELEVIEEIAEGEQTGTEESECTEMLRDEKTEVLSEEIEAELKALEEEYFAIPMLMSIDVEDSSIGISNTAPKAGQENVYEYSENDVTWMVPASGYYDLYCYGAQGGKGGYDTGMKSAEDSYANVGEKGAMRGARAFLKKGTELVIRTGQMPGNSSCSYGEGSTHGESWVSAGSQSVNGYEISSSETLKRINNGSGELGSSCGARTRMRGYPDGEYGGSEKTVCDSNSDHSGGAVGGGGGGSSCILCGDIKILSAKGGNGGTAHYECPDGKGTAAGGSGGGVTALTEADGISWCYEELDETESSSNEGHGYVLIRVVTVAPIAELEASITDWTTEDIKVTATIKSEGQGLLHPCYSWETDEEGNDIWTDAEIYTVSQNGTYTCKVRDVEGNIGEATIEITNIDRLQPEGEIIPDITDWTKEDVQLTITADDTEESESYGKSGLADKAYLWGSVNEAGEKIWNMVEEAWTSKTTCSVSQNGVYLCKVRDNAGNETEFKYTVKNIDVTPPKVSFKKKKPWYQGKTEVFLTAEDIQPGGEEGCGLAENAYSFDGETFGSINELTIEKEGRYLVWVKDRLGNVRIEELELSYDKRKPMEEDEKDKGDSKKEDVIGTEFFAVEEVEAEEDASRSVAGGTKMLEHSIYGRTTEKLAEENEGMEAGEIILKNKGTTTKWIPALFEKNTFEESVEKPIPQTAMPANPPKEKISWKKVVLYSVWMAAVLCGLIWILADLLFEHVTVYRKEEKGKYKKIGRCLLIRKKDYIQINLIHLMKKGDERDYMLRFAGFFALLHKKEKVLVRTWQGVELRNVAKKIEIVSCNSEKAVIV